MHVTSLDIIRDPIEVRESMGEVVNGQKDAGIFWGWVVTAMDKRSSDVIRCHGNRNVMEHCGNFAGRGTDANNSFSE